eukprot:scaffold607_cov112-Isochrysis_galbana.AAC.4
MVMNSAASRSNFAWADSVSGRPRQTSSWAHCGMCAVAVAGIRPRHDSAVSVGAHALRMPRDLTTASFWRGRQTLEH